MGGGAGSKLGLAREAAIRTAELLSERDSLGVIGFDGAASWIAPMRPLTSRQAILDDIAALRPGGGTDIYPALKTAINTLDNSDAALKHIILLSDGMTTPGDYAPLIQGAFGRDITLTTIGIGTDADSDTMKDFAGWGGGEFYLVTQPHAIPAIFTRETLLASRAFLIEEPFRPAMGTPSEIVRALDPSTIPTLHGYVATQAKHRATTPLVVPDPEGGDLPLLAHWRYGLGRSVAFTSDAKGRWAREWIGQPSYTHLWTQVTRWVVGDLEPSNLAVDTEIRAGALWVTVDAYDALGSFRNFLDGEARVVAPDLRVHHLDLQQIAPGRYQGTLPVDQDGSWLVGVALSEGDKLIGQAVSEAVQPYSPEYRAKGAGGAVLEDVGRTGGGGQLTDPATVFSRPDVPRRVPTPLWPTLLAMAGFLLLADVAVRRLDWFDRAQGQARPARPAKRTRRWTLRTDPVRNRPRMQDTEDPDAHDAPTAPAQPASEVPAESYAGRLLAARKKARDRLDDDG